MVAEGFSIFPLPKRVCEAAPKPLHPRGSDGYAPSPMEVLRTLAGRVSGALRAAGPFTVLITALGLLGSLLVLLTEFATIAEVDVLTTGTCREIADPAVKEACRTTGFEQHGGAFLLLGGLALLMTIGLGRRGSRPAAVALLTIGAVVLGFALARDVPKTKKEGLVGQSYNDAKAGPEAGLYMEVAGGALLVLTGVLGLARPQPPPTRARTRAREGQDRDPDEE